MAHSTAAKCLLPIAGLTGKQKQLPTCDEPNKRSDRPSRYINTFLFLRNKILNSTQRHVSIRPTPLNNKKKREKKVKKEERIISVERNWQNYRKLLLELGRFQWQRRSCCFLLPTFRCLYYVRVSPVAPNCNLRFSIVCHK
jgi:hypothetical protein